MNSTLRQSLLQHCAARHRWRAALALEWTNVILPVDSNLVRSCPPEAELLAVLVRQAVGLLSLDCRLINLPHLQGAKAWLLA